MTCHVAAGVTRVAVALLIVGALITPVAGTGTSPAGTEEGEPVPSSQSRQSAVPAAGADGPTVVILVRHADKEADGTADPGLDVSGKVRAGALAEALRDAHVDAILVTPFERTRQTARPVAEALGIEPEVVAIDTLDKHVEAVASAILGRLAGRTVLVVGHSNTVPAIAAALGTPRPDAWTESEYDRLLVVILSKGRPPALLRWRF